MSSAEVVDIDKDLTTANVCLDAKTQGRSISKDLVFICTTRGEIIVEQWLGGWYIASCIPQSYPTGCRVHMRYAH